MGMPTNPIDIDDGPENSAEAEAWYNEYDTWMQLNGKRPLAELGRALWEAAANSDTVSYGKLGRRFDLNHRSEPRGVPWMAFVVSEYARLKLGLDIRLTSIVVLADSESSDCPKGCPSRGFFKEIDLPPGAEWRREQKLPTPAQRQIAAGEQKKVWQMAGTKACPF